MKTFRSFFLTFAVLTASLFAVAPVHAWEIDAMNEQIEKTNVVLNGVCSGTLISKKDRLVLTAHHCISDLFEDYTQEEVDPKTGELKEVTKRRKVPLEVWQNKVHDYEIVSTVKYGAKIVASDADNDVALIQITDPDYVPAMVVTLAPDSYQYKRGLTVYAVGNPAIRFDNSVSQGIISAPERTLDFGITGSSKPQRLFQHSATTIGGNSGGSILNDKGELIGTVTGGVRGAAISFAIPVKYAKEMIRKAGFAASVEGVETPVKIDTSKVYPYQ